MVMLSDSEGGGVLGGVIQGLGGWLFFFFGVGFWGGVGSGLGWWVGGWGGSGGWRKSKKWPGQAGSIPGPLVGGGGGWGGRGGGRVHSGGSSGSFGEIVPESFGQIAGIIRADRRNHSGRSPESFGEFRRKFGAGVVGENSGRVIGECRKNAGRVRGEFGSWGWIRRNHSSKIAGAFEQNPRIIRGGFRNHSGRVRGAWGEKAGRGGGGRGDLEAHRSFADHSGREGGGGGNPVGDWPAPKVPRRPSFFWGEFGPNTVQETFSQCSGQNRRGLGGEGSLGAVCHDAKHPASVRGEHSGTLRGIFPFLGSCFFGGFWGLKICMRAFCVGVLKCICVSGSGCMLGGGSVWSGVLESVSVLGEQPSFSRESKPAAP